jgi:hypothetical protein
MNKRLLILLFITDIITGSKLPDECQVFQKDCFCRTRSNLHLMFWNERVLFIENGWKEWQIFSTELK